jgi:hypothetical protein
VGDEKYFAFFYSFIKVDRYACVPMAYSVSPKLIGTVDLIALFVYTLFAFVMTLLALLAPSKFTAFNFFVRSFVRSFA